MIALVEGASRQKTPNEIALTIILAAFSIIFLIVTATLYPMARYFDITLDIPTLIALLVCLIPTTIGALLAAIGIAGMDRALAANLIAKSGKAVEVAGDIDTLLLDKTGTITLGNRRRPCSSRCRGRPSRELARLAAMASLADTTPEGKSIVELARREFCARARSPRRQPVRRVHRPDPDERHRPARRREDPQGRPEHDRPGRLSRRRHRPRRLPGDGRFDRLARARRRWPSRPAISIVGVIKLEDILKPGIRERFARLRQMGLRVVMVTGDNPLTAKAIADEAGVDDFIAQATPEAKLAYIRKEQTGGKLVAMMGDGTNDAPALAQADIGVAMNSGTQAAKEAGNMVDLDSDPTKLIEVVEIGKQLLMTRGALTTFSIANDLAKYFAVIPAMFVGFESLASLRAIDLMGLATDGRAAVGHPLGGDLQRDHHPALDPDRPEGRHVSAGRGQRALAAKPALLRPGRRDRAVHRNQADRPGHRPALEPGRGRLEPSRRRIEAVIAAGIRSASHELILVEGLASQ